MTPAFVGSVPVCPRKDGGVLQFSVSQTLLHVSISWGAFTNPSAQAYPQTNELDSLGVGLRRQWFLEIPSVQPV